jgi:DNA-directed RNA polymerase specialized sigma24 family protein
MVDHERRPPSRGDEAALFRAYNDELMRTVAGSVHDSSPQVIEDACAFAWAKFLECQPDRDRNWQGWLFRTAQRQAWRLAREVVEHVPLRTSERELGDGRVTAVDLRDRYELRDSLEDALSILAELPPRLRRIALLRALGLRQTEIGEITGDSSTRVQQLISRANFEIYEVLDERAHATDGASSPRAARLWELERSPPSWLSARIGRLPRSSRRAIGQSIQRRAWRRAALALDDLRTAVGSDRFEQLLGDGHKPAPDDRCGRAALRALDELEAARRPAASRGLSR